MKKLLALMLAAALALSLAACGGDSGAEDTSTPGAGSGDTTGTDTPGGGNADTTGTDTPGGGEEDSTENENLKATIITNEGETVEMTAEELIEACDSNEAKFNKLYQYAEIHFTGTIDYIKVDTSVLVESGSIISGQQKIVFKEGWCLVLGSDSKYDLADYDSGDTLQVITSIFGSPYDTEALQRTHDNNRVVWLVGNDKIYGRQYSDIETVIIWDNNKGSDEQNSPS